MKKLSETTKDDFEIILLDMHCAGCEYSERYEGYEIPGDRENGCWCVEEINYILDDIENHTLEELRERFKDYFREG